MQTRDISQYIAKRHIQSPINDKKFHWGLANELVTAHCNRFGWTKHLLVLSEAIQIRSASALLSALGPVYSDMLLHLPIMNESEVSSLLQAIALLKKFPFDDRGDLPDTREVAKATFEECESTCAQINEFLSATKESDLPRWIHFARERIAYVLGDLSPSLIMQMITGGCHGPGSTLSTVGNRVTRFYKYNDFPYTVSKSASMYACAAISSNPRWMDILEGSGRRQYLPPAGSRQFQKELQIFWDCTEIADYDRITFVPKDAKTDRPIAVGASLNVYLQLGVKHYMQDRLKKVGIDLSDQGKNQEYARLGSIFCSMPDGSVNPDQFSTIDLKSASDTVSNGIVALLLPPLWYAFLDDLRHHGYTLDGESRLYQKFSGMGNGFTFPLETLIFYGIFAGTVKDECGKYPTSNDFAIYGDDIIVRLRDALPCIKALEWGGFTVNLDKTFLTGPFKESCGRDYFRGTNVRPFYLKRLVTTYEDIYHVCNGLNRIGLSSPISALYRLLCEWSISHVPRLRRNYSPMDDNSDSGLCCPLSSVRRVGFWPYLNRAEVVVAIRSRILSPEHAFLQCNFAVRFLRIPSSYRGNSRVRLLVALEGERPYNPFSQRCYKVEEPGRSVVTRREAYHIVPSLTPISNWDGVRSKEQLNTYFDILNLRI